MKTLLCFVKEHVDKSFGQFNIKTYHPKEDKNDLEFIKTNKNSIFDFLNKGYQYAGLGNFKGCANPKSLYNNVNIIKICYDDKSNEMIAISVYTGYQGGKKCVGITVTTNNELRDLGIIALKEIIKEDIMCENQFYWTVCSDAIEYLWQKFGGTKIPNIFVSDYLGNKKYELADDEYHFYINIEDENYKKIIFGYNSEETYNKVVNYIKNEINSSVNNVSESFIPNKDKIIDVAKMYSKNLAAYIDIIDINGWYELPEECIVDFKQMINDIEDVIKDIDKNEYVYKYINENLHTCKELLKIIRPLEINKMKI